MKHQAVIDEIFPSIQGEGPWIGQRQNFVRFAACDLSCRYCDTPSARIPQSGAAASAPCRFYPDPSGTRYDLIPNPLSYDQLSSLCLGLAPKTQARPVLSLTGGEPLLHHEFLSQWLPSVRNHFLIYLETSGIHVEAMQKVKDLVDVVSMDIKLPSASGMRPYWDEHRRFLVVVKDRQVYVKAVITADTALEDVVIACRIIADVNPELLLVLQPAEGPLRPLSEQLIELQDRALEILRDVRIIPQAHKMLNLR